MGCVKIEPMNEMQQPQEEYQQPLYLRDFVHTLLDYWQPIALFVLIVGVLYMIYAGWSYADSPVQMITERPFRVTFDRANIGEYPNGIKFSATEFCSPPILKHVYDSNGIGRFVSFPQFAEAIFVQEWSSAYARLAAEYQARLLDPKLSPVERDRIQNEFEAKRAALPRNEYVISYLRKTNAIPETVLRKALDDILRLWAADAITEKHVLRYRMGIVSPDIIRPDAAQVQDPMVALQVLRSEMNDVSDNIDALQQAPGVELARTPGGLSLREIRIRLDQILRYRLEPLVAALSESPSSNGASTAFIDQQVAYEQRKLAAIDENAQAIREALSVYSGTQPTLMPTSYDKTTAGTAQRPNETIMPQISDTFIDRLFNLTKTAADSDFRQSMVRELRLAIDARVPIEQELDYHKHVLELLRAPKTGPHVDEATMKQAIQQLYTDVRGNVVALNELYLVLSRNINPSTELYQVTAPFITRGERPITLTRLMLTGIIVLLVALVLGIAGAIIHARLLREEREASEQEIAASVAS
jgi:hypothetical protein